MFKEIKGFEGYYEISINGVVRSLDRLIKTPTYPQFHKGKEIKQQIKPNGYKIVKLYKNNKQYTYNVHRLLAETFLEKPSYAECINHIDGNKLNNNLDNLEWCTYAHNNKEAFRLGLKTFTKENKKAFDKWNKQQAKRVVAIKNNKIITIQNNSVKMAEYIKTKDNLDTKLETIARLIRTVARGRALNIKGKKSAYGYIFEYID